MCKWSHDDVIKWKHFPRYWPFVPGIHRSSVNSPHKGQWRGDLMFSVIWAWINGWVNNREAGDLRRYRAHCDVTVMWTWRMWVKSPGIKPQQYTQQTRTVCVSVGMCCIRDIPVFHIAYVTELIWNSAKTRNCHQQNYGYENFTECLYNEIAKNKNIQSKSNWCISCTIYVMQSITIFLMFTLYKICHFNWTDYCVRPFTRSKTNSLAPARYAICSQHWLRYWFGASGPS